MTDIHEDVVKVAKRNVLSATEKAKDSLKGVAERATAKVGDVLLPLVGEEPFVLIYKSVKKSRLCFLPTRAYRLQESS